MCISLYMYTFLLNGCAGQGAPTTVDVRRRLVKCVCVCVWSFFFILLISFCVCVCAYVCVVVFTHACVKGQKKK